MEAGLTKNTQKINPFLKWAGGKRWLVQDHPYLIPLNFKRYIEPFLGSAALFFHLQPEQAVLSDTNQELIDAYKAIRDYPVEVNRQLKIHHRLHSEDYYYKVRSSTPRTPHTKAACFIYLNRTCWNGLYRVNLDGQFNVPVGTKTNVILETDDFEAVAKILKKVEFHCDDFEKIIDAAEEGDFVFADPPYTVKHNINGFVKYNERLFAWGDQVRLRDALFRAKERGVKILATNAAHDSLRELYKGYFDFEEKSRRSTIASKAWRRGTYDELIVRG